MNISSICHDVSKMRHTVALLITTCSFRETKHGRHNLPVALRLMYSPRLGLYSQPGVEDPQEGNIVLCSLRPTRRIARERPPGDRTRLTIFAMKRKQNVKRRQEDGKKRVEKSMKGNEEGKAARVSEP